MLAKEVTLDDKVLAQHEFQRMLRNTNSPCLNCSMKRMGVEYVTHSQEARFVMSCENHTPANCPDLVAQREVTWNPLDVMPHRMGVQGGFAGQYMTNASGFIPEGARKRALVSRDVPRSASQEVW